jgi:hypothetical protein
MDGTYGFVYFGYAGERFPIKTVESTPGPLFAFFGRLGIGVRTNNGGNFMRYLLVVLALLGSISAAYAGPGTGEKNGEKWNDTNCGSKSGNQHDC